MLNYEKSGVNIEKANKLTNILKTTLENKNIGSFAGIYEHPSMPDRYFAAATDGIGSKIIPLIDYNKPEIIANDLIAMNLNDLACIGASPMFFLDYIATSKLDVEFTAKVIEYLQNKLKKYNTILLGGETSELKDLIKSKYFDIAGFIAGFVEKDKILKKENVKNEDIIIGLASNGIHSNGFTLIRKLFEQKYLTEEEFKDTLKPTHIYFDKTEILCYKKLIKICANITGGGIKDNITRVIPDNLCAEIDLGKIPIQPIFEKLKTLIGEEEAYNTFNMGVGFCIITSPQNAEKVKDICKKYNPFELGVIKKNDKNCNICFRQRI